MVGDAEVLEGVADSSCDAYTIAFGIRNCTNINNVLKQAYRVLKVSKNKCRCFERARRGRGKEEDEEVAVAYKHHSNKKKQSKVRKSKKLMRDHLFFAFLSCSDAFSLLFSLLFLFFFFLEFCPSRSKK